jgi:putative ABC transport system permease protein
MPDWAPHVRARLASLRLSPTREAEIVDELSQHLEDRHRELMAGGVSHEEATRLALAGFQPGNVLVQKMASLRQAHATAPITPGAPSRHLLGDLWQDVRYAGRMLRRHPIWTATATMSLAIGIGLNAAVFSVVDWVLLRPLPYPASHELVHMFTAGKAPVTGPTGVTHDEFVSFSRAAAIRQAVGFSNTTRILSSAAIEPVHVIVSRVVGNFFATFGVHPDIGRPFSNEEMAAGMPVIVLGHELWQRSFFADPQVVGGTVLVDGAPHTIVGVMPAGRGYPRDAEVWRPLTPAERASDDRDLSMVARLGAGVTSATATVELGTLAQAVSNDLRTAWVDEVHRTDVGTIKASLQALFAAAMLTLLIACANVAALVGAQNGDRLGEMAIRGALGASPARIFRQLITESLILAMAGGLLGLLFGRWTLSALIVMAPVSVPRLTEISLDGRILGVGLVSTVLTGLAVGLIPALRLSSVTRTSVLNRLAWHRTTPQPHARRAFVLVQVAVAVVLASGAGLLIRSLYQLVTLNHGFAPDRLVAVRVFPPRSLSGDAQRLLREVAAESETVPGVEAVAYSMRLPTQVSGLRTSVSLIGEGELAARAVWRPVSSRYFETVGIPVTAGRPFSRTDSQGAPRVAIVNISFVRELLGGRSAPGMRLTTSFAREPISVVGVVGDVTPAGEADRPAVYVPVEQSPIGEGHVLARTAGDPRAVIPALTARLRRIAPDLPLGGVERVAEALEESRGVTRVVTQLAATFAGLALLLAMIGVYGLTAGDVSARWNELAIRLALGASRRNALWTVIRPCAAVLAAGTLLGTAGALGAGRGLSSLLHGVGPADLGTLVLAPLLLAGVGLLAAMTAARRVLRADPAVTLRSN